MLPGTALLADAKALALEKNSGKDGGYETELGRPKRNRR